MPEKNLTETEETPAYFKYWGKAKKNETGGLPDYHLLVYHCLDVAAVAAKWLEFSPAIRKKFISITHLNEDETIAWVLFFIALHDYGKFDLRFQRKAEHAWSLVNPEASQLSAEINNRNISEYYHGTMGLELFYQDLKNRFEVDDGMFVEQAEDWEFWQSWFLSVSGHHGFMKKPDYDEEITSLPFSVRDRFQIEKIFKNARMSFLSAIEALFIERAGLSLSDNPPFLENTKNKQSPATFLAGFCSVCDWLGSSDYFPYYKKRTDNLYHWYQTRLPFAEKVLHEAGMISHSNSYQGIQPLLGKYSPRQIQCLVDKLPREKALTIVEASTGSGKTEAALAYAWQLIDVGLADSIVFALPTQATANAMLKRLENVAPLLFSNQSNVVLAHGRAKYNEDFIQLKQACKPKTVQGKDEAWVQCGEWLSQSRKRIFLGQIGVCTIDQVLVSVLPIKHKFVRGFGVARSVLIVDEVHAYDAYMYGLLDAVLEQQKLSGGSVVLLSATLPWHQKKQLSDTWGATLEMSDDPENNSYPLITCCMDDNDKKVRLFDLVDSSDQQPKPHMVSTELVYTGQMLVDDALLDKLLVAVSQGAQVCLICNLVDVAQATYHRTLEKIKQKQDISLDQLLLFHSRYTFHDRQHKETEVINLFGTGFNEGPNQERQAGHLLIATQVVEQSLDIDFDWLITQLCPVDLLFQRMGRLHRHAYNQRPKGFEKCRCTILLPTGLDYHWHSLIYGNSRVLWRSQKLLEKAAQSSSGYIEFPSAYRRWIEPVYQEETWPDEPKTIIENYEEFIKQKDASYFTALQIIRKDASLRDSDSNVSALTRDGEMSLNIIPAYTNSQGKRCLLNHQVANELPDDKKYEALNLNTVSVPGSWRRTSGLPDADQNGLIWLDMHKTGDIYSAKYGPYYYRYQKNTGLQRIKQTEGENA